MSSAIQALVERPAKQTAPVPATVPQGSFWKEFLRVQTDKFILLALIAFLHFAHAPDNMQAAAIGGLIVLIQGQRFKLG